MISGPGTPGQGIRPPKPTPLPVRPNAIPRFLHDIPRWLLWRLVWKNGKSRWDKPPYKPDGEVTDVTDPASWNSFKVALEAYQSGRFDDMGFALHRPPEKVDFSLIGFDIDKCRDPKTGLVEAWARDIVLSMNTYAEASVSGTGVRGFLLGKLPPTGRKKGRIEVYETARYLTVTGRRLDEAPPTVETRQAELLAFHCRVFGEKAAPRATNGWRPPPAADADDAEIIRRMLTGPNGEAAGRLWVGDVSGFQSASEAGLALANHLAYACGGSASTGRRTPLRPSARRNTSRTPPARPGSGSCGASSRTTAP